MSVRLGRGAVTGGTAAPPLNNIITGNYSAGEGEGRSTSMHFLLQVNGREEKAGNGIIQRTCMSQEICPRCSHSPMKFGFSITKNKEVGKVACSADTDHLLGGLEMAIFVLTQTLKEFHLIDVDFATKRSLFNMFVYTRQF